MTNPFPGLRPFEYHEYELFFGREEQYEQMIAKLGETRFLAVVGTSGSGKSSLVKAGLYPALYGGLMMSAGPGWRIAEFRPKDDPIRELAFALNHKRVFGERSKENGSSRFKLSESTNWARLCSRISEEAKKAERSPSGRILNVLTPEKRVVLSEVNGDGGVKEVVQIFNGILNTRDFYQPMDFQGVPLSDEIRELLLREQKDLTDGEIEKLNRLLLEASFPQEIAKTIESQAHITEVSLRRGDLGLIEVVKEAKMFDGENLLVVVDQFEELFRYAKISEYGPHGNQAAAFVKLLLEASTQNELPIYVVLTMRSDYLGDCAKFWGLPEAINRGQYLIPRLTRDQRREAIMGPVGLRGAKIAPRLVNQLLNDMGDDPDQLPILQHALMRTWDRWESEHNEDKPIDVDHYEAIGRMAGALSKHADEAYHELPDDHSGEIAEKLFKCLSERGTGHVEIRRPTRVSEILEITGARFKEVVPVIDVFRKEGRSFLVPPPRKHLSRDMLIDISHESLIRNWNRLKEWVKEERESADVYRRLVQTSRLHQQKKAGVMTDLEIVDALEWKKNNKPNLTWASRYHLDLVQTSEGTAETTNGRPLATIDQEIYEGAMGFLEKSQRVSRKKARIRTLTKALVAASIFLIVALFALWFQKENDRKQGEVMARLAYSAEMKLAQRELEAGNFGELNRLLHERVDRPPVSPGFLPAFLSKPFDEKLLRGFEWYHIWKLSHDESTLLDTYGSQIVSLEYLNNSHILATVHRNGQIFLRDKNGNSATELSGAPKNLLLVAFSSDLKTVVIAQKDNSIGVWEVPADLNNPQLKHELQKPSNRVPFNSLAYSLDNQFVAAGTPDGDITVWSTTGSDTPVYTGFFNPKISDRVSLAFSGDSRWLAAGYNQNAKIVDLKTKSEIQIDLSDIPVKNSQAPPSAAPINCLAFSPDGKTLAIGRRDASIALWDLSQKRFLTSLRGHSLEVLKVLFSDETTGVLASAGRDGGIRIWDAKKFSDSEYREELIKNNASVEPNSANRTNSELLVTTLYGHAGAVTTLAFTGDHKTLVSGSDDKTLKRWSIDTTRSKWWSIDTTRSSGALLVSSTPSSKSSPPPPKISSLAFSTNGEWLAAGRDDGTTMVWIRGQKPAEGILLKTPRLNVPDVTPVAFSKNQVLAVATGNADVTLWQISNSDKPFGILNRKDKDGKDKGRVMALAFSDDGEWLATGGRDNEVEIWEVATLKGKRVTVPKNSNAILSLAFAPGSKVLAIGTTNSTVELWDTDKEKEIGSLTGQHTEAVRSIAFSADGSTIATGSSDTTVRLWDARTHKHFATLQGHSQGVLSVSFVGDGRRLVTAGQDGSVRLWDSERLLDRDGMSKKEDLRTALIAFEGEGVKPAFAVAVSSDGSILGTGNADGTVLLRYGATKEEIAKQISPPQ